MDLFRTMRHESKSSKLSVSTLKLFHDVKILHSGFDPRSHLPNFHPNTGTPTTSTTPLQPQEDVQKPKTSNTGNRTSGVKTHSFLANNDYGTSSRNLLVAATGISTTSAFPGVDPTKMVSAAAAQAAAIVAAVEKQEDMKDRLWPCPACKVPFKTAYELQAHLSHHTKGERTVPCEVCGKLFVSAERVRVHMRSAHGEKSCSCEICGSGFSYRCKLMDHMRTHTGDKPFHCDVCGKSFSQKNHLTRHSMIHTGERPYPCDFCGRGFYRKDKLSRHRRIHTGSLGIHTPSTQAGKNCSCEVCGNGLSYHCKLLDHMKTHTGEKPFHCDICGKGFSQKNHLTRHSMIHTGERPYTCDFCGRGFYRKDKLSRHKRIHTAPTGSGRQQRDVVPNSNLNIPSTAGFSVSNNAPSTNTKVSQPSNNNNPMKLSLQPASNSFKPEWQSPSPGVI
ncbi:uncharacterized protein LOC143250932 isoform X2 [Tachypleus tridentatus]|uniref:uncharacterized protein LOC143250932 isoform X2 n=1 Tax=Tachypleus tridentatus TaxID=6853 RepID=UPI003FD6A063